MTLTDANDNMRWVDDHTYIPLSQTDRVVELLSKDWTCGSMLAARFIGRYSARIHEAKRRGYRVERRPCQSHHHRSRQYEWRITSWQHP